MLYGMYISAAGADVQSQRLQILSNNLANVDTPGFKRELAVLQAQHARAIAQGHVPAGTGGIDDVGGGVQLAATVTDFARGNMRETGRATDLAIDSDAFFLVEREGQPFLTRAGNFHFSTTGQLQTEQGYSVLTAERAPVTIDPALPYRFLEDGSLEQAGTRIELALVQPHSRGDLVKAGENLFAPLSDTPDAMPEQRRVRSGFLEMSTVKPALEMMELIETSRAYEANIRMIQHHDTVAGALVNRVLRTS